MDLFITARFVRIERFVKIHFVCYKNMGEQISFCIYCLEKIYSFKDRPTNVQMIFMRYERREAMLQCWCPTKQCMGKM